MLKSEDSHSVECNEDLNRWVQQYPSLHPRVRLKFAELDVYYRSGDVRYAPDGEFSTFNLRHPTHPATNLSEARAMSELWSRPGVVFVELIEDQLSQEQGHDIRVFYDSVKTGRVDTVSVKLATITPTLRGFTIANHTRGSLKKTQSDWVAFVDNINERYVLIDGATAQGVCSINHFPCGTNRAGIFYDLLGGTYEQVTHQFTDYNKNNK